MLQHICKNVIANYFLTMSLNDKIIIENVFEDIVRTLLKS